MKVLLINPNSASDYQREAGPAFIPYGIVYLASYGRERSHGFSILDRNVDGRNLNSVMEEESPDVVGVSVMTGPCIKDAIGISRNIRAGYPGIKVVWGGVHPSMLYEQVLREDLCDFAVIKEGEETLVELLDSLEKGKPVTDVAGLAYKAGDKIYATPGRGYLPDLDGLPDPAWDLIPLERYPVLTLNTSRGCPSRCVFCYNQKFNEKHRAEMSAQRIVGLIRRMHEEHGVCHVDFLEDNFSANWKRVEEFCALMKTGLSRYVSWACEGRISGVSRQRLMMMKDAGCGSIRFGVESGSPRMLEFLKKDITLEMVRGALEDAREAGLKSCVYLISGIPGETERDRKMSIELLYCDRPDNADTSVYRPYPGTELYDYCVNRALFTPPKSTIEWAKISDQYDPGFDVSGAGSRELRRFQLRVSLYLARRMCGRFSKTRPFSIRASASYFAQVFLYRLELTVLKVGLSLGASGRLVKLAGSGIALSKRVLGYFGRIRTRIENLGLLSGKRLKVLLVESSRNCNLRCLQCANHSVYSEDNGEDRNMKLDTFMKLKTAMRRARIMNLDNHGEPFMNPDLGEMIRIAKETNPAISIRFTTNLQFSTEKRLKDIMDLGIDELQVSINGLTKKTYEGIQVNAGFERLVRNLELIRDYRKCGRAGVDTLAACFVSNRLNIDELPYLPAFCRKYGFDLIKVNSLQSFHEENSNMALYNDKADIVHTRGIYEVTKHNAEDLGVRINFVRQYPPDEFVCSYPADSVSVSYSGEVAPCWMLDLEKGCFCFFGGEKIGIPCVSFGNILEEDFWAIWNKAEYRRFREDFKKGRYPDYCKKCPVGYGLICA